MSNTEAYTAIPLIECVFGAANDVAGVYLETLCDLSRDKANDGTTGWWLDEQLNSTDYFKIQSLPPCRLQFHIRIICLL
jgi:hypothetical protein